VNLSFANYFAQNFIVQSEVFHIMDNSSQINIVAGGDQMKIQIPAEKLANAVIKYLLPGQLRKKSEENKKIS
jgi:hypothetical protein